MTAANTKVLLVGAAGQLGQALVAQCPAHISLLATTRRELDASDASAVSAAVEKYQPQVIINAAAYTAVDKAETDQVAATSGNVQAPMNLAQAALSVGARLLHVSTDFVFDGTQSTPYAPTATTAPLGVYGLTKRDGEIAVINALGKQSLIVRTAWVYAATGKNFLLTMLRLMREKGAVRVVADQIGTPTCTHSLADVLWRCAEREDLSGILHWTDAGTASWYDFAVAIAEEAHAAGLLTNLPQVTPIASAEFPTPVKRPSFSVLDKSQTYAALALAPVHWRQRLREVLQMM